MEVYGEKPKKFTAAWFSYVWEYYKIHIIVCILIVAAVIYTVIALNSVTGYDLYVCISGNNTISKESQEKLSEALKASVSDINGDGEINIKIFDYSVPDNYDDIEYTNSMNQKFHLELQAGDSFLYIVPKESADRLVNNSTVTGAFEDPKSWSGRESDNIYFAKAYNSEVFKNAGIVYDNFYIGVRNTNSYHDSDEDKAQRKNAVSAANFILGN